MNDEPKVLSMFSDEFVDYHNAIAPESVYTVGEFCLCQDDGCFRCDEYM